MQVLIKKGHSKPVEIIDGLLIETDTPTLFTDRATVDSATSGLKDDFNNDDYELREAIIFFKEEKLDGNPGTEIKVSEGRPVKLMGDELAETVQWVLDNPQSVKVFPELLAALKKYNGIV